MSTLRSILGRTTQQAVIGGSIVGTACYLAIVGTISGESFLVLASAVTAFLFRNPDSKPAA